MDVRNQKDFVLRFFICIGIKAKERQGKGKGQGNCLFVLETSDEGLQLS